MIESVEWMKHLDHTAASSSPLTVEIDVCRKKYGIFFWVGEGAERSHRGICAEDFGKNGTGPGQ